ncbi:MAG TPA: hypothetical protein VFU82_05730 [Gammaproteobacteria bacterium]|nr:hypothetical protein [Gammaproteobacteria bacterium]
MKCYKTHEKSQSKIHPMMALLQKITSTEELEERWEDKWNADINKELTYDSIEYCYGDYHKKYYWVITVERPIYYAISLNKAKIATAFLMQKGVCFYGGKTLVGHALKSGCSDSDIKFIIEKVDSTIKPKNLARASSRNETTFDLIHKHFRESNKTFNEMLIEDFLSDKSQNVEFFNALISDNFCRKNLKAVYLEKIKNSPELKSILKMGLALGVESPFIKFLRASQKHVIEKDTKHYKALIEILKKHPLVNHDMNILKQKLMENITDGNFKPKPAFAALYFTFQAPDGEDDYTILKNHLMITIPDYTPANKECLENLVKTHLTKDELARLKKHLFNAVEFNETVKEHGQQHLKVNHLSPFTTIVCTQLRMRGEDKGKTYRALRDQFGLFKQEAREAQVEKPQQPGNAYPEHQAEYKL